MSEVDIYVVIMKLVFNQRNTLTYERKTDNFFWQNKLKLLLRERSWSQGKFLTPRKTLEKEP